MVGLPTQEEKLGVSPKRVLILGDSLTFGRAKHQVWHENAWPSLLEAAGYTVFHRGIGGADSGRVIIEATQLLNFMIHAHGKKKPFDVCFIQVGIVDCTPRLLSRRTRFFLCRIPYINSLVSKLDRTGSIVKCFGRPWVDEMRFQQNVKKIRDLCSALAYRVHFLEIARPTHNLIKNCGDFEVVVNRYNRILQNVSQGGFLSVYGSYDVSNLLLLDGHHLSILGHEVVAKNILSVLSQEVTGS